MIKFNDKKEKIEKTNYSNMKEKKKGEIEGHITLNKLDKDFLLITIIILLTSSLS